jgi:hypothetical protein
VEYFCPLRVMQGDHRLLLPLWEPWLKFEMQGSSVDMWLVSVMKRICMHTPIYRRKQPSRGLLFCWPPTWWCQSRWIVILSTFWIV